MHKTSTLFFFFTTKQQFCFTSARINNFYTFKTYFSFTVVLRNILLHQRPGRYISFQRTLSQQSWKFLYFRSP